MKKKNQDAAWMILILLLPILVYILSSDWTFETVSDGFRLGTFPLVYLVIAVGLISVSLFDSNRYSDLPEFSEISIAGLLRIAAFIVAGVVFSIFRESLGYIPCVFLLTFVTHFIMGQRSGVVLMLFPIALSIASYFLFVLLGVHLAPIPGIRGILL